MSDHIPTATQLNARPINSNNLPTIPAWVSNHPQFPIKITELLNTIKYIPQPNYSKHQYHKDIMYTASKHIITTAKNDATTLERQQYWTLAAFRHSHKPEHPLLQRSILAYPHLNKYFTAHICTNKQALHNHLEQLTTQLTEQKAKDNNSNDNQPHHDDNHHNKSNNLQNWLARWSTKKRQSYTLHITREDGQPTTNTNEAAYELHKHWDPKFTAIATQLELVHKFLQPHVHKIDPTNYQWTTHTPINANDVSSKKQTNDNDF